MSWGTTAFLLQVGSCFAAATEACSVYEKQLPNIFRSDFSRETENLGFLKIKCANFQFKKKKALSQSKQ